MLLLSVFGILAASAVSSPVPDGYELETVAVLHRHGYRAPLETYPTDPHGNESIWSNGFGQLTNAGKSQMHEFGKWLRNRYDGFLPAIYNDRDVYAKATEISRDMMSAAALLSGLYEPTGTDVWNPDIKWQPIPVHATPLSEEHTLMTVEDCPKLTDLVTDLMNSDYVRGKFDKYSPTTSEISKNAGYEDNKIVESIWLYDVFLAQSLNDLDLPDWTGAFFPDPLHEMLAFLYRIHAHDKTMQRLACGPLLKEVLSNLDETVSGNSTYKMRVYSVHDQTIVDFLRCLDVDDEETLPPFAAAVLVELYRKRDDHFVAVKYKVKDELRDLQIPKCGDLCKLATLKESVKTVLPTDWHKECLP
ncbi:UNVERIFIED_CONTAM: hypothetical protein PYX00_003131 [Menopon gallinae]|uniref:acid phosphatase n=1 Tax=Menopon gallinae TaxID=328185 RepID=A0AAW2I0N4_9NEOP